LTRPISGRTEGDRAAATSGQQDSPVALSKRSITLALVAAVVMLHLLNVPAVIFQYVWPWEGSKHYIEFFGVSGEGKLPTFYSGVTMLAAATLLGLIAARAPARGAFRAHWAALGVIFMLMSMDEMVQIHELSTRITRDFFGITGGPLYHAWVIPAMVFLAFMAVAYGRFLWKLPRRSSALFIVAGCVYVGGALVMEMVDSAYAAAYGHDLGYGVLATLEEVGEMSGIVIFIYALMDHLQRLAPESRIRFVA
jgi:hypothetical protein